MVRTLHELLQLCYFEESITEMRMVVMDCLDESLI